MENFMRPIIYTYYCIVYVNKRTDKIDFVVNNGTEKEIREYWDKNEEPNYHILDMTEIKNPRAFLYYQFYNKLPKRITNYEKLREKFDFYKIILGAELPTKYRYEFKYSKLNIF